MFSLRVNFLYIENQFLFYLSRLGGDGWREGERDVHVDNKVKRSYHTLHHFDSPWPLYLVSKHRGEMKRSRKLLMGFKIVVKRHQVDNLFI